jgi:hypothetical protein
MGILMTVLDEFIESIPFDLEIEFDPDVEKIEQTKFNSSLIYKYFGPDRRSFFLNPQLRFSQREVLNDPTEMTVRWKQAAADGLRKSVTKRLTEITPKIFGNPDLVSQVTKEELKSGGVILLPRTSTRSRLLVKKRDRGAVSLTAIYSISSSYKLCHSSFIHLHRQRAACDTRSIGKQERCSVSHRKPHK